MTYWWVPADVRDGNFWLRIRGKPSLPVTSAVVLVTAVAYLWWAPLVPDLAAQVARTNVVHTSGLTSWWTGWFGGLSLPTYSLLGPPSMAILGVRLAGLLAASLGSAATRLLVRDRCDREQPRSRSRVAFLADLLDGRVTFTIGLAFAAWSLVAARSRRGLLSTTLAVGGLLCESACRPVSWA